MNLFKRRNLIVLFALLAISVTVFSRDSDVELSDDMSEDESKKIEQPANDQDDPIILFLNICAEHNVDESKINIVKELAGNPEKKSAISQYISSKINDMEFTTQGAERFIGSLITKYNTEPAKASDSKAKRKHSASPERMSKKPKLARNSLDFYCFVRDFSSEENHYLRELKKGLDGKMLEEEVNNFMEFAKLQLKKSRASNSSEIIMLQLKIYGILALKGMKLYRIADLCDELLIKIPFNELKVIDANIAELDAAGADSYLSQYSRPPLEEKQIFPCSNRGLLNHGNDDFINAILQVLIGIPDFEKNIKILLTEYLSSDDEIRPLLENILDLFASMRKKGKADSQFGAHQLRHFLSENGFIDQRFSSGQHDVHEFFISFLNALSKNNSLDNLCAIPMKSYFELDNTTFGEVGRDGTKACRKFERREGKIVLSINIVFKSYGKTKYYPNCSDALKAYFEDFIEHLKWPKLKEDKELNIAAVFMPDVSSDTKKYIKSLDGNELHVEMRSYTENSIKCKREMRIQNYVPLVLIIHLQRFDEHANKLNGNIAIPIEIDLYPYANKKMDHIDEKSNKNIQYVSSINPSKHGYGAFKNYRLTAVVFQSGTKTNNGHCWTCRQDSDSPAWRVYDDQEVTPLDNKRFYEMLQTGKQTNDDGQQGAASMLFYTLNN